MYVWSECYCIVRPVVIFLLSLQEPRLQGRPLVGPYAVVEGSSQSAVGLFLDFIAVCVLMLVHRVLRVI